MSTRNYDASRITLKMQNRTLYGYYNSTAKNSSNVYQEQPNTQLNSVVVERQQGACSCATSLNPSTYNLMGYNTPGNAFLNPVTFGGASRQGPS